MWRKQTRTENICSSVLFLQIFSKARLKNDNWVWRYTIVLLQWDVWRQFSNTEMFSYRRRYRVPKFDVYKSSKNCENYSFSSGSAFSKDARWYNAKVYPIFYSICWLPTSCLDCIAGIWSLIYKDWIPITALFTLLLILPRMAFAKKKYHEISTRNHAYT